MIKKRVFALLGLIFLSFQAHPAPIAYEFSGEITGGSGPFALGSELTAIFDYDPATPAFRTNVDGAEFGSALANYGLFSIYLSGISNFVANIEGQQFATGGAAVLVGDGSGGDPLSGLFANAGAAAPGWTGLSFLGYDLVGFSIYTVGTSGMLSSQAMPDVWPYYADISEGVNTGLNMTFVDQDGAHHVQNIWGSSGGNVSIGPVTVSEPASLALILFGLAAGVVLRRHKRR